MKKLFAAFAAFAIPLAGAFADDDYGPFGSDNDIVYDESPPATMIMLENVTLKMGATSLMEDGNCVALYRKSDSSLCGLGSVYEYGGNLYLDISVMGISPGTQVHFKVWRKSDDTVFDCDAASDYTLPASGDDSGFVINVIPPTYAIAYAPGSQGAGNGQSATKTYGTDLSLAPALFTRTGYSQTGWATTDGGEKAYDLGGTYTTNAVATLFPTWGVNSYTMSFNPNGGAFDDTGSTVARSAEMDYGAELSTPAVSRDGHTFAGWSPAVPATVPAENATYVAQWTVNSYTVTFDAGEGTGGWSATLDYGAELSPPTVTWTGHEFKRWVPDVPATVPVGGGTYVAQWDTLKFSITFDPNGGAFDDTGSTVARSAEMDYGAELSTPAVSRDGHTFAGWSPAVPATVPAENATYVVQWTVNSYTVTFDAGEGTGGWSDTLEYGAELSPPTVTWTGHEFKRWVPDVPAAVPVGGGTYVAQWDTLKFSITFDPNGGAFDASAGTAATTEFMDYGAEILAPAVSREGYELTGWSPALPATASADTTYAAQWSPRTYGVTLDAQGGSGGSPNVTATYDAPMPAITVPVSSTQSFRGYFTEIGGTGTQYYDAFGNSAHVWDVASDGVTLHAFWENVATLSLSVGKFGKAQVEIGGESFQVGPDVSTNIEVSTDAQLAVKVTAQPGSGFAMSGGEAECAWTPFTANQSVSYAFIPQLQGASLNWKFSKAIGRYFGQVKIPAHPGYEEALEGLSFLFADRTKNGDNIPYAQLWDASARAPHAVVLADNGTDYRGVSLDPSAFAGVPDGADAIFGASDATLAAAEDIVPAGERQLGLFVRKRISPVSGNETSAEVENFLGYLTWLTAGERYFLPIVAGAAHGAAANAMEAASTRFATAPLSVARRTYAPTTLNAAAALCLRNDALAESEPKARIVSFEVLDDGSVRGFVEAVAGDESSASFGATATVHIFEADSIQGPWVEGADAEVDSATGGFSVPAGSVGPGHFFKATITMEAIYE